MDRTVAAVSRIRRFAQAMDPNVRAVDEALPALRRLMEQAGVDYRIAGGVAVIHHGYVRATDGIDILLDPAELASVEPLLPAHGFVRESRARWRHVDSGVRVDLLLAGASPPRPGSAPYPSPGDAGCSEGTDIVSLPGLVELKLQAGRHQDKADVVALLKPLADSDYSDIGSRVDAALRMTLLQLRRDALKERAWDDEA